MWILGDFPLTMVTLTKVKELWKPLSADAVLRSASTWKQTLWSVDSVTRLYI